jgi:hypothetical protein
MLLAYRLVRLIETHSEELSAGLLEKLQHSPEAAGYSKLPPEECRETVLELYERLGEWLLGKTEDDIKKRCLALGARRATQGVLLSELLFGINLTKEHLLEFLKKESHQERPFEASGELEVLQLLEHFFDRAVYYAAAGFEAVPKEEAHAVVR